MKQYEGKRLDFKVDVRVNGVFLNPRLDLWKHSSTGFEWGYSGSGPAQLALALLADALGDDQKALQWHQDFKYGVVVKLDAIGWKLTDKIILGMIIAAKRNENSY